MNEVINVPDGWELKKVSQLVENKILDKVQDGNHGEIHPKSSDFVDNGIPFIMASDIQNGKINLDSCSFISENTYNKLRIGFSFSDDILLSHKASIGFTAIVPKNLKIMLTPQVTYYRVLNKEKFSNIFLYYYFQFNKFQNILSNLAKQSTRDYIGISMQSELPILFPKEKKEQEKIAKILSTLDTAIESTQKLIEKEKNIKKGLMNDLLQNGIDKSGKIRTLQTHKYKDSELGLIPENWEVISLKKIGNVITGNTPSTDIEEYYNGNIPFIGPIDFTGQKYILNTEKTVTFEGLNNSREIPKNSILTVCIGSTIGKIALSITKCCTNQQVNTLICNKEYFYEFIYYSMKHFLLKQLNIEAGLQAVPIVNKSSFEKLILPCSSDFEEQKQIAEILNKQDEKIEKEEENLAKLKELKKGLMNDLLSGKVRV